MITRNFLKQRDDAASIAEAYRLWKLAVPIADAGLVNAVRIYRSKKDDGWPPYMLITAMREHPTGELCAFVMTELYPGDDGPWPKNIDIFHLIKRELQIGDMVRLRGGTVKMTVMIEPSKIGEPKTINCSWHTEAGLQSQRFPVDALELVPA